MSWHYMPVWRENSNGDRYWVLCEVYLDKAGRLHMWQEDPENIPSGEGDVQSLRAVLAMMLLDACRYVAVPYDEMNIGDAFTKEAKPAHVTAQETLRAVIEAFRSSKKRGAEPEVTR